MKELLRRLNAEYNYIYGNSRKCEDFIKLNINFKRLQKREKFLLKFQNFIMKIYLFILEKRINIVKEKIIEETGENNND